MSIHDQKECDFMSSNGSAIADARSMRRSGAITSRVGDADDCVMALLAHHVPLTLLADLAVPGEPLSAEILRTEGLPEQRWWA